MRQILQITLAEGWHAAFAGRLQTGEIVLHGEPLAGWALVEDRDEEGVWQDIVGLTVDGDVQQCDLKAGFVGYLRDGENIEKWRSKARRMYAFDRDDALVASAPGD